MSKPVRDFKDVTAQTEKVGGRCQWQRPPTLHMQATLAPMPKGQCVKYRATSVNDAY